MLYSFNQVFSFLIFGIVFCKALTPETKCSGVNDPWKDGVINGPEAKIRVSGLGTDFASMKILEELNNAKIKGPVDYRIGDLILKNMTMADISFTNFTKKFNNYMVSYSYVGGVVNIVSDIYQNVRVPTDGGGTKSDTVPGIMQITTSSATMDSEAAVYTLNSQPQARNGICNVKLNDLEMTMASNVTMTPAQERAIILYVKVTFEAAICTYIRNIVLNTINRQLKTYPSKVKLDDSGLILDYSMLLKGPEEMKAMLENGAIDRFIRAVVYLKAPTPNLKFYPPPLFPVESKNVMFEFWLSDYVLNTLFYVAHENDYLTLTAVPKFVSAKNAKLLLSTCLPSELCIGNVFSINRKFSNVAYVNVTFQTTEPPKAAFGTNESYWNGAGIVKITVIENNKTTPLLTANACVYGTLAPKLALNTLYASTTIKSSTIVITESPVKTLTDDDQNKLRSIVNAILEELINGYLSVGFKLPLIDGITLVNPRLQTHPRTCYVASNLTYTTSENVRPRIG